MSNQVNFLEFVSKNPPPFLPGQTLYWLDPDTGQIIKYTTKNYSLALTSDWKWKMFDPVEEKLVTPDEDPYYCTSKQRAREFRNQFGTLTYVVLKPAVNGTITSDGKRYDYFKKGTLDVTKLRLNDTFFTAIMRFDAEVKEGMIIKMTERDNYLILPGGKHEQCLIRFSDSYTEYLLQNAFDN